MAWDDKVCLMIVSEVQRQKTYLRTCALSEDSDQTAQSRSLIRIFTEHIMDSQGYGFFIRTTNTLIRLLGCRACAFMQPDQNLHLANF